MLQFMYNKNNCAPSTDPCGTRKLFVNYLTLHSQYLRIVFAQSNHTIIDIPLSQ